MQRYGISAEEVGIGGGVRVEWSGLDLVDAAVVSSRREARLSSEDSRLAFCCKYFVARVRMPICRSGLILIFAPHVVTPRSSQVVF